MDPISLCHVIGAVAKFASAYEKRKAAEAQAEAQWMALQAAQQRQQASQASQAATAAAVASGAHLPPEQRRARADDNRRDIFRVLGVLSEQLFRLGLVNTPWLPFARAEVLACFRT